MSTRCVLENSGVMMCGTSRIPVNNKDTENPSPKRLRTNANTAVFAAAATRFCNAIKSQKCRLGEIARKTCISSA